MKHKIESTYKLDKTFVVYFTKVKDSPELTNLMISRVNSIQTVCLNKEEIKQLKNAVDKLEV